MIKQVMGDHRICHPERSDAEWGVDSAIWSIKPSGKMDFVGLTPPLSSPLAPGTHWSLVEDGLSAGSCNQIQVAETQLQWCGGGQSGAATRTRFLPASHSSHISECPLFSCSSSGSMSPSQ